MATTFNSNINPDKPRNRGDYDVERMSPVTPGEDIRSVMINRVAWGAVFSGVVLALVVHFILNLVGVGVGVIALTPDAAGNWSVTSLSLGAGIWLTVSGIIAAYCGGYTAGRLSGDPVESTAGWHGLVSWAVSIIVLSGLVVAGAGVAMGGNINAKGQMSAVMPSSGATADNTAATPSDSDAAGAAALPNDTAAATPNDTAAATPDNTAAGTPDNTANDNTSAATPSTNPPSLSATTTATGTPNSVQAPLATPSTMDSATISKLIMEGSLLSAIALVLGAIAAWFGGVSGTIKPTVTSEPNASLH